MTTQEQGPQCPPVPVEGTLQNSPGWIDRLQDAANWGFTQGLAAAQRLAAEERQRGADAWPEPITDRPPIKADADSEMQVQYLSADGLWSAAGWRHVAELNAPWHHTLRWRPPAPRKREQAIKALREQLSFAGGIANISNEKAMQLALQALEEAGDE